MHLFGLVVFALLGFLLPACGNKLPFLVDNVQEQSPELPASTSPAPSSSTPFLLEVRISIAWDNHPENVIPQQTCRVPQNASKGSQLSCEVSIPEGQLHYSHLILETRTENPFACHIVNFRPYYYRASYKKDFTPEWSLTKPLDCSEPWPKTPAGCYNGPATTIVPDFPSFTYLFQLANPEGIVELNADIPSPYTARRFSNNRWVVNSLVDRARSLSMQAGIYDWDAFVGGENNFQDYSFECLDQWADLLGRIALTVRDIDTGGPNCDSNDVSLCNQYPEWNSQVWVPVP